MASKTATPPSKTEGTDPDSINFFRLCHIVLEDIPDVLRGIFKAEISSKHKKWIDGPHWGRQLRRWERFQSRLNTTQKDLLAAGQPMDWDTTLLVQILLYSSQFLLTESFPGNQMSLKPNSPNKLISTSPQTDFTKEFQNGDVILCDLGQELARNEVKYVSKTDMTLKYPIKFTSQTPFDVHRCTAGWRNIEELSFLRNKKFAHCKSARISASDLKVFVQKVEKLYKGLNVSKDCIDHMTSILTEKFGDKALFKEIKELREKWHSEMGHYIQLSEGVDCLQSDMEQVKVTLKVIEEESKKHQIHLEEQQQEIKEIQSGLTETNLEVSGIKKEIEGEAKDKSLRLESLETRQTSLEEKHSDEVSVMKHQQGNLASRISHSIELIKQVSDEQKGIGEKMSSLEETGKQMSSEVEKTEEFVRQLSVKDDERQGQIKELADDVGVIKSDITKVKEEMIVIQQKGPTSNFSVPHFEGDISFHSEKFHAGTRQWLLDDINSWTNKPVSNRNQPNMCLVAGNPGMGKSVLAAKLCTNYRQDNALAGCFFFQYNLGRRSNPKMLVQSLCHQFQSTVDGYSKLIQDYAAKTDPEALSTYELFSYLISEPLNSLRSPLQNMMVVIDALDECDFDVRPELLKLLIRDFVKLPRWIKIILTARPDKKILHSLKKIRTVIKINPEDPRNLDDIRLFLKDFLKTKMLKEEFAAGVELLVQKSEGMFLYFEYAIDTLEDKDQITLEELKTLLPDGIDDYYERNFHRLFDSLGQKQYQTFLQSILMARSDFPQDLVGAVLGINCDEAKKVLSMVSTVLPIHNGLVCIFHKSLRDWLLDEELAGVYAIDPLAGHKHLATLCTRELKTLKNSFHLSSVHELTSSPVLQFVVENVVHHTCNGMSPLQVLSIVQDLQFMFFRLLFSYGATTGLLDDINECLTITLKGSKRIHQALLDCHNFVRSHAHILNGNPSLIFQCALNEPRVFAERLGINNFLADPLQAFPGLKVLLQVKNKSEQFISPLITFSSEDNITSCAISPDSKWLLFSDSRGFVYYWDAQTGEVLNKVDISDEFRFPYSITACSVSADQKLIAYGSLKQALNFDGEKVPLLDVDIRYEINSCIFSPRGDKIIAFASYQDGIFRLFRELQSPLKINFYVVVWNLIDSTSKTLHVIKQEESRPMCACFSPDGKKIFSGYRNGVIVQWDAETCLASAYILSPEIVLREDLNDLNIEFLRGSNAISAIVLSQNSHFLAVCTKENLQIWDAAALEFLSAHKPQDSQSRYTSCAFSPDNCHLAAGTVSGFMQIFAIKDFSFKLITSVKPDGSSNALSKCLFVSPSNVLCTSGNSGRIYEMDTLLQSLDEMKECSIAVHPGSANTSIILPHRELALTLGKKSICLWDVTKCELKASVIGTVGGFLERLSANGKTLLTYGDRCYIEVWDVDSLTKTKDLVHLKQRNLPIGRDDPDESSPTDICHCAVSDDGVVVGGTGNGDIFVWYGENLDLIKELEGHECLITFIEFSPSGGTFVSADMDGVVLMWQIPSERHANFEVNLIPLTRHEDSVEQLCYSSQGRRFVSCSMDKSIHLYNGPSGDLIAKLVSHDAGVLRATFSSNESLLASGDEKGKIVIWDGVTGQLLHQIKPTVGKIVLDLQFVKQDKYICSRDSNAGCIIVHEVSTGEEASRLSFTTEIFSVSASSHWKEKSYLVCCLKDGSVKFVKLLDSEAVEFVG